MQNAFRDIGVTVLRDTDMQRDTIGEPRPGRREADLRRGDLLYMPGHVLIYAGDGSVIHADGASMTVRREPLAGFMRPARPRRRRVCRPPPLSSANAIPFNC